ncbi:MAG: isochorismatase family protein, partial [Bryobacterales bacterium]|nr:isochorismatase family protein [Bryobacterales bacterium]
MRTRRTTRNSGCIRIIAWWGRWDRLTVPNVRVKLALGDAQQVLLEKQTIDCFTNVNLAGLLEQWNASRYFVYGVVTEICVRKALEGESKGADSARIVSAVATLARYLGQARQAL